MGLGYSRWGLWPFLLTSCLVLAQVVLRILFPDRYILQGFFRPNETGQWPHRGVWEGGGASESRLASFQAMGLRLLGLWGRRAFPGCWLCLWGSL